jgi:hypothetical protein
VKRLTGSVLVYEVLGVHDARGLHVTWLKGLQQSNLEIAVYEMIKKVQLCQVAGQLGVTIPVATCGKAASQVRWIAVDEEHMMCADVPQPQIRIAAVVNGQAAVDA